MLIPANLQTIAGTYDFTAQGGAIGTAVLNHIALPRHCRVIRFSTLTLTAFTSGGSATVSFGFAPSASTNAANVTAFSPVWTFDALNQKNSAGAFVPIAGTCNEVVISEFSQVIMAIGGAALTAGKLMFTLDYTNLPTVI